MDTGSRASANGRTRNSYTSHVATPAGRSNQKSPAALWLSGPSTPSGTK